MNQRADKYSRLIPTHDMIVAMHNHELGDAIAAQSYYLATVALYHQFDGFSSNLHALDKIEAVRLLMLWDIRTPSAVYTAILNGEQLPQSMEDIADKAIQALRLQDDISVDQILNHSDI